MAGSKPGARAQFNAIDGNDAPYFRCASHDLNLVLCHACKVPTILCMIQNVRQLGKFFSYPKRICTLEDHIKAYKKNKNRKTIKKKKEEHLTAQKFKTFCPTKWVETQSFR